MSSNPYENEPGFEGTKFEDKDATAYAAKVTSPPFLSFLTLLTLADTP